MSNIRIFIDMDGVVANLSQAASVAYGIDYNPAGETTYGWITEAYNAKHPDAPITHQDFHRLTGQVPRFWANIPFFPWARDMVQWFDTVCPAEWFFLTKCVDSPDCPAGKFESLVREFNMSVAKRAIMTWGDKSVCCHPGDILIDDLDRNRIAWQGAGGMTYAWRELGPNHPEAIQQVQECLAFCYDQTHRLNV